MLFVNKFYQKIFKRRKAVKENTMPYVNENLPYASENDITRCIEIVRKELSKKNVIVNDNVLKEITEAIMGISYAKGGDYSEYIIQSFARTYIEYGQYKKFLNH